MAYEATNEVVDYVVENHKLSDDELLGGLVQMSVPFGSAKNVLKSILEEKGLRMSKTQRDDKATELLSDFTPTEDTDIDEVNELVENLVEELDCTVGIARAYIRAVFAEVEITMPKATSVGKKRGPRTPGFSGDAAIAADFALNTPEGTLEEFTALMESLGKAKTNTGKDKASRWYPFIADLVIFGKKWQDKNC